MVILSSPVSHDRLCGFVGRLPLLLVLMQGNARGATYETSTSINSFAYRAVDGLFGMGPRDGFTTGTNNEWCVLVIPFFSDSRVP
jgi:hypothetical protein